MHRSRRHSGGYILLLTILVSSIILSISFGISTIAIKELRISNFLRDSTRAVAAASSGVECALYWDRAAPQNGFPYSIFATSTSYNAPSGLSRAVCNDGTQDVQLFISDWVVSTETATGTTMFSLSYADGTCVDVTVIKVGNESTTVIGDGYNTCDASSPRRTQREIAVFTNI